MPKEKADRAGRKNISIHRDTVRLAEALIATRPFGADFSKLVTALIREEYKRKGFGK
jgi:hypothetical protein